MSDARTDDAIREENDKLRALLAWGTDPCIYCGLRASDMHKCASGFPGCARSDDMQADWSKENWTRTGQRQEGSHG
jgi:hypothetical protein